MAKKKHRGGSRPGSGRKPLADGEAAITVAVTVPPVMLGQLDTVAEKNEWNRSEAVRQGIQLLIDSQPKQ